VKVSVSLPEEDLAFIDEYARRAEIRSRSAVLHRALALLREHEMEAGYASAWRDWADIEDRELWEATSGDGTADAPR
jgi:Arc/MetJ-type ribon-helix-helix transcriptional regulator